MSKLMKRDRDQRGKQQVDRVREGNPESRDLKTPSLRSQAIRMRAKGERLSVPERSQTRRKRRDRQRSWGGESAERRRAGRGE